MNSHIFDFGEKGKLVFDTCLSPAQIAKFGGMIERLIVVDNTAYLRLDELHGVLLTKSKQQARDMVMANLDLVKPYLVTDKVKFQPFGVASVIKPAGIYLLLDHFASVKAIRAPEYRASLAVLCFIMAKHPGVALGDWKNAKAQFQATSAAMRKVKGKHSVCQLTGHPFYSGDEKHVHHIEGKAENPTKADDLGNLVVIHGWVHDDYHSWTSTKGMPVCRASFWFYADKRGYAKLF
jgi:hypothetical protein